MAWEAWVEVLPDFSKFDRRANDGVSASLATAGSVGAVSFGSSFKSSVGRIFTGNLLADVALGAGQKIGEAIGAGFDYALGSVSLASDLNETTSAVRQVFGDAADDIIAFAQTANQQLGQTRQSALVAAQTFGVFGQAAGLTGKPLSDFSTSLVSLSGDLASFFNADPSEVIQALGAGLRGESEPLRRFGVLLDDATLKQRALTLGIYDGTGSLTQQQRVLAAQAEIFAQTGIAQGDFARTSDGLANQQRILEAALADTQTQLGQYLLPGFNQLVSFANTSLLPQLGEVIDKIGPKLGDALAEAAPKIEKLGDKLGPVVEQFADLAAEKGIPAVIELLNQAADAAPAWIDAWAFLNDPNAQPAKFFNDLANWHPFPNGGLIGGLINDLNASQRISDSAEAASRTFADSYAQGLMTADGFDRAGDAAVAALADVTDRVTREGGSGSFGAGANYADSIAAGIRSGEIKVGLAGESVALAAVKGTKKGFKQASPSKLGLDIGGNFTRSIGMGMVDELGSVQSAADRVVAASTPSLGTGGVGAADGSFMGSDLRPYFVQLIEAVDAKRVMVADGQVLAETANRGNAQQTALGAT